MTAIEVLAEVRAAGGCLIPAGDKLRWRMPVQPPARLVEAIRERKPDLLMLLCRPEAACPACAEVRWWRDSAGAWHCPACEPETPPDPFGPLPADREDALAELELRAKLRQPELARLTIANPVIARAPVSVSIRACQIAAASVVWAAGGPEGIARRRAEAWADIPPALVEGRRVSFTAPAGGLAIGEWCRLPKGAACEVLARDADTGAVLVRALAAASWLWCPAGELVSELDWGRQ